MGQIKSKKNLLDKVKEAGFETIGDFVKANLNYLPEDKQRIFQNLEKFNSSYLKPKEKEYHYSTYKNGKG